MGLFNGSFTSKNLHLNFWKEEKPDYPPLPPRARLVVRQMLKVGKGKHIPKEMEGGGFPQACDEEEAQRLRQNKARKTWKVAQRVASSGDLGGLGSGRLGVWEAWGLGVG